MIKLLTKWMYGGGFKDRVNYGDYSDPKGCSIFMDDNKDAFDL